MNIEEHVRTLEAARGRRDLLALATVDIAYADSEQELRARIKDALLAAAVPHWCDKQILSALLEIAPDESAQLIDHLRALTVVEEFPARGQDAFNVHEAARRALRDNLRVKDQARFVALSSRARAQVSYSNEFHARIEALYHLFAVDQDAAAHECEELDREIYDWGRPEITQSIAVVLEELTVGGWLSGPAQIEALLAPVEARNHRGEAAQLEAQARAIVDLATKTSYAPGLGRAQCLLGDVMAAKGRLYEALAAHSAFADITAEIVARDQRREGDLVTAYARLGNIYQAQGRLSEAMRVCQTSLVIAQRMLEADPKRFRLQRQLAVAHSRVGDILEAQGQLDDAVASYTSDLRITGDLVLSNSSNANLRRDLALTHMRIGHVHEPTGRLDEALEAFHKELAINYDLVGLDPSHADWQRGLSLAHSRIGGVYQAKGHWADALASFREALIVAQRLSFADPSNPIWQSDVAAAFAHVGDVYQAQGRLGDAMAAFQKDLLISERLVAGDSLHPGWLRSLSLAHARVGGISRAQGSLEAALSAFRASLEISLRLVNIDESHGVWQRDLAAAHSRLGDIYNAQGKSREALVEFERYRDISERFARIDETDTGWQRELSMAHGRIGDVLREMFPTGAQAAYQKGHEIIRRLASRDISNLRWRRALAVSYSRLGNVAEALESFDEALEHYLKYRDIAKMHSGSDPFWLRELGVATTSLGGIKLANGDLQEALWEFKEALRIARELVDLEPTFAEWRHDLALAHFRVGKAYREMNKYGKAQSSLRWALRTMESAVAMSPSNKGWKLELAGFKRALG